MATFRPDPIAFLTGQGRSACPGGITPVGGGGKFTPEGRVLDFPGNTILCHVDQGSAAFAALCALQDALRAGPHADRFTFLPKPSFHMTVFQGISADPNDPWPDGVDPGLPVREVSEILLARLANVALPQRVRVAPRGIHGGNSVTLEGADPDEEELLRSARLRLRDATGLTPRGFGTYTFHITLGYFLAWVSEPEARAIQAHGDTCFETFLAQVPEITLGPFEFCEFKDMHHFERLAYLGTDPAADDGGSCR